MTTEREKEWPSGSAATPDEALGFFDSVVGIQEVGGSKPLAPATYVSVQPGHMGDTTYPKT
jgi:hypothetical protein